MAHDDDDNAAILSRRAFLIQSAVALGVTSAAVEGAARAEICLSDDPIEGVLIPPGDIADTLRYPPIFFDGEEPVADPGPLLDRVVEEARALEEGVTLYIQVEGHADLLEPFPADLAYRRAERIRVALLERGLPNHFVGALGRSATELVAPPGTPGSERLNNRVIIERSVW